MTGFVVVNTTDGTVEHRRGTAANHADPFIAPWPDYVAASQTYFEEKERFESLGKAFDYQIVPWPIPPDWKC